MMTENEDFHPDWASPPGNTIRSILQERDLQENKFCKQIELTTEDFHSLLEGQITISLRLARKLTEFLGASVEFWMSRDFQYQQDAARLRIVEEELLSELPFEDMIEFGWLQTTPQSPDRLSICLKFFDVPNTSELIRTYREKQYNTSFRTSFSFEPKLAAVAAWLREGEIEAANIDCAPWNALTLRETIASIRSLSRKKDPKIFLPALKKYCAASGVAFVIVRAPSGCRASGAVRFLNPNKALIQLSFRYLSDDHFWFTLFHEIGHLLLHELEGIVLEETETDQQITKEEEEANKFAADTLIPVEYKEPMMRIRANSRDVIRFAFRIGVSPGIVVGQLQHLGKLRYDQLNSLKRRFTWV